MRALGIYVGLPYFLGFSRTKQLCDGMTDPNKWPICRRLITLSFHPVNGLLYVADVYYGLLVVGPLGGLATQLARGFKFANGLDVDLLTGNVYFSDASFTYEIRCSIFSLSCLLQVHTLSS